MVIFAPCSMINVEARRILEYKLALLWNQDRLNFIVRVQKLKRIYLRPARNIVGSHILHRAWRGKKDTNAEARCDGDSSSKF